MPAASRARSAFELGLDSCAVLFLPMLVLASKGAAPLAVVRFTSKKGTSPLAGSLSQESTDFD